MYQLTKTGVITVETGAIVPADPSNRDWQAYQAWCAEGNQAAPADEPDIETLKETLCRSIDRVADAARLAIAGDPLRVVEYERAAAEAKAHQDAGYTGAVPPAVKSWAEAKGWTGKQAADDILAEAAAWNTALYGLRDMRLKGKEAVRQAADEAAAQAAADAVITQIRAAVTSVGNAK